MENFIFCTVYGLLGRNFPNIFFGTTFNPFQSRVAFHIGTGHLIYTANQMTGFCVKCNTGLKWVKSIQLLKNSVLVTAFCCLDNLPDIKYISKKSVKT